MTMYAVIIAVFCGMQAAAQTGSNRLRKCPAAKQIRKTVDTHNTGGNLQYAVCWGMNIFAKVFGNKSTAAVHEPPKAVLK